MYDVFYISLLKQDTTKKGQVDKTILQLEFNTDRITAENRKLNQCVIAESTEKSRAITH